MATDYANSNDQKLGRFLYVHLQLIGGNKADAPQACCSHNGCNSLLKISIYRSNWELCFSPTCVLYISMLPRPCEVVHNERETHRERTQPHTAMANGDGFINFPEEVGSSEREQSLAPYPFSAALHWCGTINN